VAEASPKISDAYERAGREVFRIVTAVRSSGEELRNLGNADFAEAILALAEEVAITYRASRQLWAEQDFKGALNMMALAVQQARSMVGTVDRLIAATPALLLAWNASSVGSTINDGERTLERVGEELRNVGGVPPFQFPWSGAFKTALVLLLVLGGVALWRKLA